MSNDLRGKNAIVLGASASGGSGFAIAKALARAGANAMIAARKADRLEVYPPHLVHAGRLAMPEMLARLRHWLNISQGLRQLTLR